MPSVNFEGEFSFVNKDAKNISSTDHRTAVAWHVMHRYEPYKRQRLNAAATSNKVEEDTSTEPSPSSNDDQRVCPQMRGSPLWVRELVAFVHDEVIPSTTVDPAAYAGLLEGWHDLPVDSAYDLHDKAYLALLATLKASRNKESLESARQLYTEATSQLRTPTIANERLCCAVLSLFSVQTVLGHSDTARHLLKLLWKLVESLGGLSSIEHSLQMEMLSCDIFFAIRSRTRPLFHFKSWRPRDIPDLYKQRLTSNVDISELRDFSTLTEIMISMYELFDVYAEFRGLNEDLKQWCRARRYECLSRLADHQVSLTLYPHHYSNPRVESALANAALLLAVMVGGCPEPIRMKRSLLCRLRKALMQLQPGDFGSYSVLLRSITALGSLVEQSLPYAQPWFQYLLQEYDFAPLLTGIFDHSALQQEVEAQAMRCRTSDAFSGLYLHSDISWGLDSNIKLRTPTTRWNYVPDENS